MRSLLSLVAIALVTGCGRDNSGGALPAYPVNVEGKQRELEWVQREEPFMEHREWNSDRDRTLSTKYLQITEFNEDIDLQVSSN